MANWGTVVFMVRPPIETLARDTAETVTVPDILDCQHTQDHWIITWRLMKARCALCTNSRAHLIILHNNDPLIVTL